VDDPVGLRGGLPETVEVVEIAAANLGTKGRDGLSRCVGAGEPDDLMAVVEKLGDDGGADVA
jgi:hypothetical protein